LAVSCGLGRHWIEPGTAGQLSGVLPLSHHASQVYIDTLLLDKNPIFHKFAKIFVILKLFVSYFHKKQDLIFEKT
jgi:hypothetical protein